MVVVASELPFKVAEPVTATEPVNWCVSDRVSPNIVEPLEKLWVWNVTEELTI